MTPSGTVGTGVSGRRVSRWARPRQSNGDGMGRGLPPVFVVGMPRSGTTLLARLLETCAPYTVLPESHFFSRFVWTSLGRRSLASLEAAWAGFARSRRWRLAACGGGPAAGAAERSAPARYRRVFLGWVEQELAAAGSRPAHAGWVENTPAHLEGLPFVRRLFPEAHILGVVRDPRAVHASLIPLDWNNAHPAANAERWRWYARRLAQLTERDPEHVRIVAYETLVRHPAKTLADLARWLDVPFDPAALQRPRAHTHGFDVATEPWKARALHPPDPARIESWVERMSGDDVAAIERWAWPAAGAYGYQRRSGGATRAGPAERWAVLVMRARLAVCAALTRLRVACWRRG